MKDPAAQGAETAPVERRLATILMADVFGYSRMMGEDEERTVRIFRGHRAVFDELLKVHRGRIFNTAGDAILAEFPSAVEAVRCATEIQAALRTRNEHLPEAQRMWFRIGINLGDVIIQEGDLLGDGVNVAARIQTVAEPGGVCISGSVYDQIQNKLTLQIKQLGEKSFKNIAQPVRTFSISDESAPPGSAGARWRSGRMTRVVARGGMAALVVVLAGGAYWLYRDREQQAQERAQRAEQAQRTVELARDIAASAAAQKEARLLAELQAARDALNQADANKRRAEQDRVAAEAAQREAKLQGELKSAKEALSKADQGEKKADQERKSASAAVKSAELAAQKATEVPTEIRIAGAKPEAAPAEVRTASANAAGVSASDPRGVDRFDGIYAGRMCSLNADGTPRCWNLGLTVQHGALSATWPTRFNNQPGHAKGTITSDGVVNVALDGYNQVGKTLVGSASGRWADNKISVSGNWSNNVPIDASWTWAPDASPASSNKSEGGANNGQPESDAVAPQGRGRRARR